MLEIYNKNEGKIYHRYGVQCVLCGYTDEHFLLSAKKKSIPNLVKERFFSIELFTYIKPKYNSSEYMFMYIDDWEL